MRDRTPVAAPPATAAPASRVVMAGIVGGIIASVMTTILQLSLAALIFSGPLADDVARGVGLTLWGACVLNLVMAVRSSRPGMVVCLQSAPAAVLALATGAVAADLGGNPEARFATAVAVLALASLVTGTVFWVLGRFRLGSLVRLLPYPVLGGFLAGTGWLLVGGGMSVATGAPFGPVVLQPNEVVRWLPGLVFAVVLLAVLRTSRNFLMLPGMIFAFTGLFYGYLWLHHVPFGEAAARGWLLGPFPKGGLWQPPSLATLALIDWRAVLAQSGKMATAALIATIGLLLNGSGLELVLRRDIDLNHELRATGLANLVAGFTGSPPGYLYLGMVALGSRMGAETRLLGVVAAACCGVYLTFGATLLSAIPRVVLAGMLLYLGLGFLVEWLYDSWFRLPRLDYVLILLIMATIATAGVLPGIVLGLAVAVVLFVVSYSRISAIKHALSGAQLQSRLNRAPAQQTALRASGDQILILQLQGFLFFATASDIVERVRHRLVVPELPRLRFVLIDFRQVTGVDSTVAVSLIRLQQLAQVEGVRLVVADIPAGVRVALARAGFPDPAAAVEPAPDLDRGLEWCEEELLSTMDATHGEHPGLLDHLRGMEPNAAELAVMLSYFERRTVDSGAFLMRRDEPADDLYFVESALVSARTVDPDGKSVRLESMRGGRIVGELGFCGNRPRTADVMVDEPGVVYRLTRDELRRMERESPAAAAVFHRIIARLLAERAVHLLTVVDALQR